jgi:hypothetical protein
LALLLLFSDARAQTTIDATKISCKQFILLKVADPTKIALWMSGYYESKRGNTSIDVELLKELPEKIKNYCLYKGRDNTVMEVVEKLLSEQKTTSKSSP